LIAGAHGIYALMKHQQSESSPTSASAPPTVTPVAEAALEGLLLSSDQINTAMGATGMTVTVSGTYNRMVDDSAAVADEKCRVAGDAAEVSVYAGSGWTALRGQEYTEPGDYSHEVHQNVVSFLSANDAAAFFTASAQHWPACRQYTENLPSIPNQLWTMGPVTNANDMLSTSETLEDHNGWSCERALTVRNNIAVDVTTCSYSPSGAAVNIAQQIAAKVP
jgi:serine/threonine kinase PknH